VVRVTEAIEVLEESLPFDRKIVRSEALAADAPPQILQSGRPGLQEITVRTVYHDGVEVERQRTRVTMVEEPRDEIVMIGIGSAGGTVSFTGAIAYISGGSALLLEDSTAFPRQLETGSGLDGRVFELSPTGSHLLYTRVTSDTDRFQNSLWVLSTEVEAEARELEVENVLWAGWNPANVDELEIAYSTGEPVDVPPGWQANNDMWLGTIPQNEERAFEPRELVDSYPASYGWWGGNYAWSPDGAYIGYSYADEVGVIDLDPDAGEDRHLQLQRFTDYDTQAEWVWLPTLSWSPDSRYLAFSQHGGTENDDMRFDVWAASVPEGITARFAEQVGIWSHPHWSPYNVATAASGRDSQIAFLRASNPLDGLRSPYSLWLMDADGSNSSRVYPPEGENSHFPQDRQFMAWGPTGRDVAYIFDQALYLLNLDTGAAYRISHDDTVASRPSWAPYGAGIDLEESGGSVNPFAPERRTPGNLLPN
jgi:Tol biopolymer transport system component